jgi:hypothetical protein
MDTPVDCLQPFHGMTEPTLSRTLSRTKLEMDSGVFIPFQGSRQGFTYFAAKRFQRRVPLLASGIPILREEKFDRHNLDVWLERRQLQREGPRRRFGVMGMKTTETPLSSPFSGQHLASNGFLWRPHA